MWRDAPGRGIVIPQYTTPDNRDRFEAGDLVEVGVDDRFALDLVTKDGATAAELTVLNILFNDLDQPGERAIIVASLVAASPLVTLFSLAHRW